MGCLSLNGSHGSSISRGGGAWRLASSFRFGARGLLVVVPILGMLTPVSARASCADALAHPAFAAGPLITQGTDPISANFALTPGRTYLIEVAEHDNDASVEVLDSGGRLIVRVDHPERRTGTRRAVVTAPGGRDDGARNRQGAAQATGTRGHSGVRPRLDSLDPSALRSSRVSRRRMPAMPQGRTSRRGHATSAGRSARDDVFCARRRATQRLSAHYSDR